MLPVVLVQQHKGDLQTEGMERVILFLFVCHVVRHGLRRAVDLATVQKLHSH